MTSGESGGSGVGPGPAQTGVPELAPQNPRRNQNRILIAAFVVLIIVLAVIIAALLDNIDKLSQISAGGPTPRALLAISGPGKGDIPAFERPLSVAWAPNGDIYVSDTGNARVCVFDASGRFKREFGRLKANKTSEPHVLEQPAGIAFGPAGDIFVADVRGGAVVVFDERGMFVKRIRPRTKAGTTQRKWAPTDVAVTSDRVYVTDAAGVAVFSVDGSLLYRIDSTSDGVLLGHPNGIVVRPDGSLVISDTNNGRVVSVEPTGSIQWIGRSSGGDVRLVGLPRGLALAADGSILVVDAFQFDIERLSDQGVSVGRYGGRGNRLGSFEFPNDVDVRADQVLVADKENNRVQLIRWPGLLGSDGN